MAKKLYVGNLPFSATDQDLMDLFAPLGAVESASVIIDNATGRSKGFGFVEMAADDAARNAISSLNGSAYKDRTLTVSEARPQQLRGDRKGFGGGQRRPGGSGGWNRR
mgnify:CR=1 FL=1